jgi:hypothetical protein
VNSQLGQFAQIGEPFVYRNFELEMAAAFERDDEGACGR